MKVFQPAIVLLAADNSNGIILFSAMGLAAIWGATFYAWMLAHRRKQKGTVEAEWTQFMKAVEANNVEQILVRGNKVIWNWHLSPERRRVMLKELEQRKEEYPELVELWQETHHRTLGYYPVNQIADN